MGQFLINYLLDPYTQLSANKYIFNTFWHLNGNTLDTLSLYLNILATWEQESGYFLKYYIQYLSLYLWMLMLINMIDSIKSSFKQIN